MNQAEVDKVMGLFADSDYSRYPALQDLSHGTMLAIGILLNEKGVEITEQSLLRAGLAFLSYSMDEGAFANSEDQYFMDLCDDRRLGASVIRRIQEEIAASARHRYIKRGYYVVDLDQRVSDGVTIPMEAEGIYVFTDEAIAA